ncbi:hypothetical protein TNIN_189681 [Trichonephila inaurata madagascariensis]|uniref:Uncharacterized protein n=1 Tax=Trichonephila inaurata madagascariensis TaxID=2747483 RepID=A0A8X7CK94_9ARAC|nr:hypothetical protein TNIN_189681 [Trichonephila inaurata madagascariensis]
MCIFLGVHVVLGYPTFFTYIVGTLCINNIIVSHTSNILQKLAPPCSAMVPLVPHCLYSHKVPLVPHSPCSHKVPLVPHCLGSHKVPLVPHSPCSH